MGLSDSFEREKGFVYNAKKWKDRESPIDTEYYDCINT